MTLNVQKTVAYVAVQDTYVPDVAVQKTVAYVAVQDAYVPDVAVQKAVAYVAVQQAPIESEVVQKVVTYVATQTDSQGNAYQDVSTNRPAYKTSPRPHIEFGTNEFLKVDPMGYGSYKTILLDKNLVFQDTDTDLITNPSNLPATDFNQLVLINPIYKISPVYKRMIKANMRQRAL